MPTNDCLNFFDPNKDIPAHHENQLTRAFLVVLRMSPAAHQVWLSLAAPDRKLYELQRPWSFDTQRWQMFEKAPEVSEPIEGMSILLAPDVEAVDGPVQVTDRSQVLDGIVRYGDELLIVIETKLREGEGTDQVKYLNVHGAQVHFDGAVKTVDWRDLLAGWSDLVESEIVAGAERTLIVDFLDFVDRHFPHLGPFTTLGRCKDNGFRLGRRLKVLRDEIAGFPTESWLELPGRSTLSRAYLEFDQRQRIQLVVYPADTLTQAKAFYTRKGATSKVLSLRTGGWTVEPNFHFGHMATGFVWTTVGAPLEEYVAYWRKQIANTGQYTREHWETFWRELVQQRFARPDEKTHFDQSFTNTKRMSATPRPGLKCIYSWNLSEAKVLDDKKHLVKVISDQLGIVLQALEENPSISINPGKLRE